MKHAVSVSLGNPARDKRVEVDFAGERVMVERIGTGGNAKKARALFTELDGKVDALGVGGIDMYVRLGKREYPIRAGLKLVQDVRDTPIVDGRALKYVLEKRVFELAGDALADMPRFRRAFMPFSIDRLGLAEAISTISDEVIFGDLLFAPPSPDPPPVTFLSVCKRDSKDLSPFRISPIGFLLNWSPFSLPNNLPSSLKLRS